MIDIHTDDEINRLKTGLLKNNNEYAAYQARVQAREIYKVNSTSLIVLGWFIVISDLMGIMFLSPENGDDLVAFIFFTVSIFCGISAIGYLFFVLKQRKEYVKGFIAHQEKQKKPNN